VCPENSQFARKTTHAPGKQPVRPKNNPCSRKKPVRPKNSQCAQNTTHAPGKRSVFPEKRPCTLNLITLSLFLLGVFSSQYDTFISFNQHHTNGVTCYNCGLYPTVQARMHTR
jgi:hypothetical protein